MRRSDPPDLGAWSQVEPPPALDTLVRQRAMAELQRHRTEAAPARQASRPGQAPLPAAGRSRAAAPGPGYALGMLAHFAQLTGSAVRLLWRAVAG